MPEPADRPPSLRDRIADALHCPTCGVEPGAHCLRARVDNRQPHMTRVQAADAVLPVVEAETAALRERLAHRHSEWHREVDARIAAEQELQNTAAHDAECKRVWDEYPKAIAALREQTQRAEQAERERDEALAAVTEAREALRRASTEMTEAETRLAESTMAHTEHAKAIASLSVERDQARDLLREFMDDRPCDPHPGNGFCQTHCQRPPCPHAAAKKLLAALDAEQPKETP